MKVNGASYALSKSAIGRISGKFGSPHEKENSRF